MFVRQMQILSINSLRASYLPLLLKNFSCLLSVSRPSSVRLLPSSVVCRCSSVQQSPPLWLLPLPSVNHHHGIHTTNNSVDAINNTLPPQIPSSPTSRHPTLSSTRANIIRRIRSGVQVDTAAQATSRRSLFSMRVVETEFGG